MSVLTAHSDYILFSFSKAPTPKAAPWSNTTWTWERHNKINLYLCVCVCVPPMCVCVNRRKKALLHFASLCLCANVDKLHLLRKMWPITHELPICRCCVLQQFQMLKVVNWLAFSSSYPLTLVWTCHKGGLGETLHVMNFLFFLHVQSSNRTSNHDGGNIKVLTNS